MPAELADLERLEGWLTASAELAGRKRPPVCNTLRRHAEVAPDAHDWPALTAALADAVEHHLRQRDLTDALVGLLPRLLTATRSPIGFLAEVRYDGDHPFLYSHAVSNAYKGFGREPVLRDLVFDNLRTLNGAILTSRAAVVTHEPDRDPRSGGVPPGHAELTAYLGLPGHLDDDLLAAVALANREDGYSERDATLLEPVATACALMVAVERPEG